MGEKTVNQAEGIGRLTHCPICGQGYLLNGRGVRVHIIKKHPEQRGVKKWLETMM